MKKNKTIILAFIILVLVGCEKKLEIVPPFIAVEDQALASVESIDAAISYAYNLEHNNLGTYHIMWAELMADHLFYKGVSPLLRYSAYYERNLAAAAEELSSPTSVVGVSNVKVKEMYNAINCAALIIRAVNRDVAKDDITFAANKDRILGECYFLRGVANFQLLRFFSKAWGATEGNTQLGILINKEPVDDRESQIKARSTVAEVYAFILEDLTLAESLLPDAYIPNVHPAGYNGRAYKDAAKGYLARVYFQKQDYVKTKEVINRLIGPVAGAPTSHPLNVDVTLPFVTRGPDNTDPENIFQTTSSILVNGPSTIWWNANESIYRAAGYNAVTTNSFMQEANFSDLDQRLAKLFTPTTGTAPKMPLKYVMTTVQQSINIPLIRSAEMLLDRAEINATSNNIPDAIADVNLIRTRAAIPALATNIAQGPLLDSIRQERVRELCFEGDRLWNLKRLKLPIPPGNRATGTLPWDGLELVFKYFGAELDRNPLLVNNY